VIGGIHDAVPFSAAPSATAAACHTISGGLYYMLPLALLLLLQYLGTFESEREAAQAYDRAAIGFKGTRAITNFPLTDYKDMPELQGQQQQQQQGEGGFGVRGMRASGSMMALLASDGSDEGDAAAAGEDNAAAVAAMVCEPQAMAQ
jgi:hypothetical protein